MSDRDPGVPEALPRALDELKVRVSPDAIHRLWIFPPRRTGRKETGLLAAGCFVEGQGRLLVTLAYRAEEAGDGVRFETSFREEGEAPEDRIPSIMSGVVRRLADQPGEPRAVLLDGDPERLRALAGELRPREASASYLPTISDESSS